MSDHLNTNGLVDGKIPAGDICKFVDECKCPTNFCPIPGRLNINDFSCGLARFLSLMKKDANGEKSS